MVGVEISGYFLAHVPAQDSRSDSPQVQIVQVPSMDSALHLQRFEMAGWIIPVHEPRCIAQFGSFWEAPQESFNKKKVAKRFSNLHNAPSLILQVPIFS